MNILFGFIGNWVHLRKHRYKFKLFHPYTSRKINKKRYFELELAAGEFKIRTMALPP